MMYSSKAIFVITERGLEVLKNNELPPSVLTSILRLVDSQITLETFSKYLKEHGDIKPHFEFLNNEGFIARLNNDQEILLAPAIVETAQADLLTTMKETEGLSETFDSIIFRKTIHDYLTLYHPHVIVGVTAMFNTMQTKQDFIDHRQMYSRLIAGDIVHAPNHMQELDKMLALKQ